MGYIMLKCCKVLAWSGLMVKILICSRLLRTHVLISRETDKK